MLAGADAQTQRFLIMSRYCINHDDLPHARAFINNPAAQADPGLQRVLNRMRTDTSAGKYVLVVKEPNRRWLLGRISYVRGAAVEIIDGYEFDDRLDAERIVFRLRWQQLTGEKLVL